MSVDRAFFREWTFLFFLLLADFTVAILGEWCAVDVPRSGDFFACTVVTHYI